jgi:hypothetical protein
MAKKLQDVAALLNRLIQLDYRAIDATKTALGQCDEPRERQELAASIEEHRDHIDALAVLVRNLGGEPACPSDLWRVQPRRPSLPPSAVIRAAPVARTAGQKAALEALWRAEEEVRAAYERATSLPGVPLDVLATLERHLAHERRHAASAAERADVAPLRDPRAHRSS